jgi:hypothetical protein
LSARNPKKDECRIFPSLVHSPNFTCATSLGFTQWATRSGPVGAGSNGQLFCSIPSSFFLSSRATFIENPVPTLPENTSFPAAYTPSSRAPIPSREPSGSVKPPITSSCSLMHFTFSQLVVRPLR